MNCKLFGAAVFVLATLVFNPVWAQDVPESDQMSTGGGQTLEDIMARQERLKADGESRSKETGNPANAAPINEPLGTRGGRSDADAWRGIRYDNIDIETQVRNPAADVLIQDGGMRWWTFREGPLATYGGWLLLGTIAFLAVFFLLRGRIRIDGGKTGQTVTRFAAFERFSHWLLAGSFLLLAFTGLFTLFGRKFIAPYLGKEFNASLLTYSKLVHNNVAWAFMLGLVLVFVLWVWHNLPSRTDLTWFRQAGGIIGKSHPPAKKFNAGQKIIFWSVILLGTSIAVSGLSLLFPFELQLFAKTFGIINDLGLPGLFGYDPLPTALAPQEEMQLAQAWHAIVSFVLMAIILAHIYIGSLGMEGAYDAMGTGEVDENWAEQHHSIWYEELKEKNETTSKQAAAPAE